MPRKLTIEDVRKEFEKRGYELLENVYINSKTKLRYRCPHHPDEENYISYDKLKQNRGCSKCGEESRIEKQKIPFEQVEKDFKNRNYILLEKEYQNTKTPMKYICIKHFDEGIQKVRYGDLKNNHGCYFCGHEKTADKLKLSLEFVQNEFTKRNYILLEKEYVNSDTKMNYVCHSHRDKIQSITYANLYSGKGCRYCGIEKGSEKRVGENNPMWKGGVTSISDFLRKQLVEWKTNYLGKHNYTCFITGIKGGKLDVHHSKTFNSIRDEVIRELSMPLYKESSKYTEEQLILLSNKIKEKHENIEGFPMSKEIHRLFHSIYGYFDTTVEQVYEFKERYLNNEFDKLSDISK